MQAVSANNQQFDVVIVGGGLAGTSMVCALQGLSLRVALIEATEIPLQQSPGFDDRALALSYGSLRVLQTLGIDQHFTADKLTPIKSIHVSDRGHVGMLRMSYTEVGVDMLGAVITARDLGGALQTSLASLQSISEGVATLVQRIHGTVSAVSQQPENAQIKVQSDDQERTLTAKLVVLADGGRSQLSQQLGLDAQSKRYGQTAVLANVSVASTHYHRAYERFTADGPIALLPLRDNDFKLVWTVPEAQADAILGMDDSEFLIALQRAFGDRAGQFVAVGKRASYPMVETIHDTLSVGRVALIGNAAHALHPIAGQGFNLGLRDIACLAELIAERQALGEDIGSLDTLERYHLQRHNDVSRTAYFTDRLVTVFSNSSTPLAALRNLGLLTLDRLQPMKRELMLKMMGLSGQQSKLMRGLPLVLPTPIDN